LNEKAPQIDKGCAAGHAAPGMHSVERIEAALKRALRTCESPATPPALRAALRHAVFPGGARLRPNLCLSVAAACNAELDFDVQCDVAAALELLHCASLVHDDLPCFDDAAVRRGRPSVHAAFGEELAVLAGDGLIVLAFETIAVARVSPSILPRLIRCVAKGVGANGGLVAGQAWESEQSVGLRTYHKAKTGALFEASARAGALLALAGNGARSNASAVNLTSRPSGPDLAWAKDGSWGEFGARLGEAYQVADDLRDTLDDEANLGKPVGQDMAHDRPNACMTLGIEGALDRLRSLLAQAIEAMPSCAAPEHVIAWVDGFGARLYPTSVRVHQASVSGASSANDVAQVAALRA
jgi:geranylgeranyl diphosphate synthase type II